MEGYKKVKVKQYDFLLIPSFFSFRLDNDEYYGRRNKFEQSRLTDKRKEKDER